MLLVRVSLMWRRVGRESDHILLVVYHVFSSWFSFQSQGAVSLWAGPFFRICSIMVHPIKSCPTGYYVNFTCGYFLLLSLSGWWAFALTNGWVVRRLTVVVPAAFFSTDKFLASPRTDFAVFWSLRSIIIWVLSTVGITWCHSLYSTSLRAFLAHELMFIPLPWVFIRWEAPSVP